MEKRNIQERNVLSIEHHREVIQVTTVRDGEKDLLSALELSETNSSGGRGDEL
nr:hypothetical protein [Tanacetum cinerariifolium]